MSSSGKFEISTSSHINSQRATDGNQVSGQIDNERVRRRSEKGNQSRARKKSKYLSDPYIDPNKETPTLGQDETKEFEEAVNPAIESANNNSVKRGRRKSSGGVNAVCKPEDINSSSAEMLSELHLTAVNCSYNDRRCSASKRFFSCFRRFAFLNHEIAATKDNDDSLEFSEKDNSAQTLPETQPLLEGTTKSSEDKHEQPSSNGKPKKRRRKKEDVTSADLNGNVAESGSAGNNGIDISSVPNEDKPRKRRQRHEVQNNEEILEMIKQNLEMMKSILEKAGNNLSPERRANLESEIKGLMQKVNPTVGPSSSS